MPINEQTVAAIKTLPAYQANLLSTYASLHPISYLPAAFVKNLIKQEQSLEAFGLSLLPLATTFAVTPVSNFNVGAVAFDSEGNAYLGANFELANVSINHTLHAEQSVIANAWQHGASDLALLVVNYSPCGHCRQFINEVNLSDDFRIQLPEQSPQPLSYYLPDAFGPMDLGIKERILGTPLLSATAGKDAVFTAAKTAYLNAHAPYSSNRCGMALQYADGDIVTGYYGENAAFNPSLPPLQMALNNRRLQGKDWQTIQRAVMLETASELRQQATTALLLDTLGTTLEYYSETEIS